MWLWLDLYEDVRTNPYEELQKLDTNGIWRCNLTIFTDFYNESFTAHHRTMRWKMEMNSTFF